MESINSIKKIAALVLAAGASKRLGKPKQLLPYKNTTLLNHCLQQLIAINIDVYVVLGAYADAIQLTLHHLPVTTWTHKDWKQGMGSSLSFGIKKIEQQKRYNAVLITLSDLPLLTKAHYQKLLAAYKNSQSLVVTQYSTTKGVPCLLSSDFFAELTKLTGDEGAKPIIQKYKKEVSVIHSETPYFDVDTDESYRQLSNLS